MEGNIREHKGDKRSKRHTQEQSHEWDRQGWVTQCGTNGLVPHIFLTFILKMITKYNN